MSALHSFTMEHIKPIISSSMRPKKNPASRLQDTETNTLLPSSSSSTLS